jgi:hypothetical protein
MRIRDPEFFSGWSVPQLSPRQRPLTINGTLGALYICRCWKTSDGWTINSRLRSCWQPTSVSGSSSYQLTADLKGTRDTDESVLIERGADPSVYGVPEEPGVGGSGRGTRVLPLGVADDGRGSVFGAPRKKLRKE